MASIEFKRVEKRYADNPPTVPGLDLHIRDGEFMVLVGPSGCGKSTTLRMIAGLESVTSGELWIGDRLVNELQPAARDVAMVFQNYALYPHMTVFDNMAFGLRVRKQPASLIKSKVEQAADTLGLADLLARKPGQLSGGQCQRVALGRAIVRDPQVFLFDEPLSNLDAELRVQMRGNIGRLHREFATTSVYVTHDQVEAMTLGSRIAILNRGELMQVGTPMELYNDPDNVFVAGFMGSPPMNIVPVQNRGAGLKNALLDLPRADLGGLAGELLLGIRPEKLHPAAGSPDHWPRLRAKVEMVETLGAEMLVHLGDGSERMIARLPGLQLLTPGQTLELALDPDAIYLFDRHSRQRIRTVQPVAVAEAVPCT
ncbi:ABC transporter ATP-binding protein [Microbulbifer marinus]|uniref:sn-glycerol 3-phosphate transport system ATP-binding protein/multiple sugar transport system ATP-binding protein n=1 Tax=Microbulbifer marinus TaxID=658218 RepID=A0A1H3YE70_9GAMM|nr:sn-glycerol-3-phosphate ABC transporter ATP-binding protein UgpC [Microbulbifer marinus]SEA09202.1 sn-glycerol 3-phosphate transport system ATP-binding protein/multiple sugar transport system ATP-binding protein [Microbulbifer marinus]